MKKLIATIAKNTRETVRVELDEYRGHQLLSVRVWFSDNAGEARPSPKGLSVDVRHLPALRAALDDAEREARTAGLIS